MGATLTEALLAPSTIRLFGRPFTGLTIGDLGLGASSSNPLVIRLAQATANNAAAAKAKRDPDPADQFGLARIYGFSYLGNYFKLTTPTVLLVSVCSTQPAPLEPAFATARALSLQMHRMFLPLAEEITCKRMESGKMLLDIAHLIDNRTVERYQNKYSSATHELKDCRMQLSGPWPPYHFVQKHSSGTHSAHHD